MTTPRATPAAPLRAELNRAHRLAWRRLGQPGTWWSARQRIALAGQARASRKFGTVPDRDWNPGRDLSHAATSDLPAEAVGLARTLAAAPWTIDREWALGMIDALGDARYVEAVAVVSTTVNLDVFRRAVGLPPPALPPAEPGPPTEIRPPRLSSRAGWLPMARRGEMQPDPFDGAWTPNICLALSLVPRETRALRSLIEAEYIPFKEVANLQWRPRRGLTRTQMEWLAVRVSSFNQCFY